MVFLKIGFEATQNFDRILDRGFVDVDLLEPAHQGPVLFKIVPVFFVGGRPHTAQKPTLQRRLKDIRSIHRAAAGRPGTNNRMNFIDKQDRPVGAFQFGHHGFQAFLEIAAVTGSGKKCAHIERKDRRVAQHLGHLGVHDFAGEALGNGRFADTGITDEQRIVFVPAAQNLNGPLDFSVPPDQRINAAVQRLLVQIHAIDVQRLVGFAGHLFGRHFFFGAMNGLRLRMSRHLGDTMGNVVDRVQPRHFVPLQEIDRMRFAFGKQRHKNVGARHLFAARRLNVNGGALHGTLESGGGFGVRRPGSHQAGKFGVQKLIQFRAKAFKFNAACP